MKLYLNSTLVFEGELEKGCGNQVFDYSTTIDLQSLHVPESFSPSPVSSGHSLRGASPQRHDDSRGLEGSSTQRDPSPNPRTSEGLSQARIDMKDHTHTPLPAITPTSALCTPVQRNSFDLAASEEPLPLRQQLEQPTQLLATMEQTVTTQPSSSRGAPQWLQPLSRGAHEGCEGSREWERPLWLVPQQFVEPKPPSGPTTTSSSSVLPELSCNPGRVCRGVERTVNGSQWKVDSLQLDLLEELGEQRSDRPISGRRGSARSTAVTTRLAEEQHHGTTALSSSTGRLRQAFSTFYMLRDPPHTHTLQTDIK